MVIRIWATETVQEVPPVNPSLPTAPQKVAPLSSRAVPIL